MSERLGRKGRTPRMLLGGGLCLLASGSAFALEYQVGEFGMKLDNQFAVGAAWRAEDPDKHLIGKGNLQPGLCLRDSGNDQDPATTLGDGCNSSSNPELNRAYVAEPGSFSPNGDNGNLNFDKGELVGGSAKITSDLNLTWRNWGALVRGSYFYDDPNSNRRDFHPDRTFQPGYTKQRQGVEKLVGHGGKLLDAYVFTTFNLPGDRPLTVRAGDQVVNWGESTFLILNSINTVNPPSAPVLRSPGFDVKELLIPAGMVFASTNIVENLSIEGFYQYRWEAAVPDPVGSFFSTADGVGRGGKYNMLSFGKAAEDPNQSYDPKTNGDDATGLFSSSSRTILRSEDREPEDGGQYGLKLGWFLPGFNNGTELDFYHINYHQRLPVVSLTAAQGTCIGEGSTNAAQALIDCGGAGIGQVGRLGLVNEPLPVETPTYFLEYPEDIKLYGVSFNTTIPGGWAWSGEVAYRPKQPLQIHSVDLVLASLQPAFPANDIPICAGLGGNCLPGLPIVAVIPGRRSAVPDFVETRYRNHPRTSANAGEYIRGYEPMKVANIGTTFLNTISASNWIKADQIVLVLELGGTKVFDMPGLNELQFNAAGATTAISEGADGTTGVGGSELGAGCLALDSDTEITNPTASTACHQNPTARKKSAFPTDFSWGFRAVVVPRFQDVIGGINLEPLVGWFYDVDGIAPGPGENFIEGRSTYLLGVRWDYLNAWSGELRYTAEAGGGIDNARIDRDVISLVGRYEF